MAGLSRWPGPGMEGYANGHIEYSPDESGTLPHLLQGARGSCHPVNGVLSSLPPLMWTGTEAGRTALSRPDGAAQLRVTHWLLFVEHGY